MRSTRLLVAGGLAVALVLVVYALRLNHVAGLYVDDAWYVLLARAIASGQGYHLINAPTPAIAAALPAMPPGFPLVLALVVALTPAFPANVIALKAVSVVAMIGVGALAAVYYRGRSIPTPLAIGLALVVVLTPAFVWLATSTVMSEPLFTLAQLAAVVLVLRRRPVLGGLAAGAAALIRSAGLPILVAAAVWCLVRRERRAAVRLVAAGLLVLLPWTIYARVHATPLDVRLRHGGAHVFTYAEQFWMRRAGDIGSGRVSVRDLPSRVGGALVDVFGRDVGAIVLPELYRPAIESGEETLSVGGRTSDFSMGSMGNATGTVVVSLLLSALMLVGFVGRWRRGPDVTEYLVPLALVPIVLFPQPAYRLVLPLTPFLYGYLAAGLEALMPVWPRVLRLGLACVLGLHVLDHAQYRLEVRDAVWLQDAGEVDQVVDWMNRTLTGPGGVASTNPALIYLRTGRPTVAIDEARERWPEWWSEGIRYVVALRTVELPDRAVPYRVLFRTARSSFWVIELTHGPPAS